MFGRPTLLFSNLFIRNLSNITHLPLVPLHTSIRYSINNFSTNNNSKISSEEAIKNNNIKEEYAIATTDTGFKHLFDPRNPEEHHIIKSFVNTFVPQFRKDKAEIITPQPVAIPAVAERKKKQTFMDVHVQSASGARYIIEIRAFRHEQFDERALFYACANYANQIRKFTEADWYKTLEPIIAVQVLDFDSNRSIIGSTSKNPNKNDLLQERVKRNPMKVEDYMKHYMITDKYSKQVIEHLQMIQIELPCAKHDLFPPKKDFSIIDWWLSILKYSSQYTNEMIKELEASGVTIPATFSKAFDRLRITSWDVTEIQEYINEKLNYENYVSERMEAKKEGKKEIEKEIIFNMLDQNISDDMIIKISNVSMDDFRLIKEEHKNKKE